MDTDPISKPTLNDFEDRYKLMTPYEEVSSILAASDAAAEVREVTDLRWDEGKMTDGLWVNHGNVYVLHVIGVAEDIVVQFRETSDRFQRDPKVVEISKSILVLGHPVGEEYETPEGPAMKVRILNARDREIVQEVLPWLINIPVDIW